MIRLASILGGPLSIVRDTLREGDQSNLVLLSRRPDYPGFCILATNFILTLTTIEF